MSGEPLAIDKTRAAFLLSVTTRTIETWIKDGKLRAAKIGRTVRIPTAEIHRLLCDPAPAEPALASPAGCGPNNA